MELKDFKRLRIEGPGDFYLVPEQVLKDLLRRPETKHAAAESKYSHVHTQVTTLLVEHREAKGWTQDTLAGEARVSLRTITNLETGEVKLKPHFKTLSKVIRALGPEFKRQLGLIIPTEEEEYSEF